MSQREMEDFQAPHVTPITRARATFDQLNRSGLGLDVLETDSFGPLRIRRRGMEVTHWRRVSGKGDSALFERET